MMDDATLQHLTRIQTTYMEALMRKPNVVGVGIGMKTTAGHYTDQPTIVVMVTHKVSVDLLSIEDVLPTQLEGVAVDVVATGVIFAGAALL